MCNLQGPAFHLCPRDWFMTAISFTSGDPSHIASELDLVRPGGPPARVITPSEIHCIAFGAERTWRDLLGNYSARVEHVGGQAMIGGIAHANVVELARDLAKVAPSVVDERGRVTLRTMRVRICTRRALGIDGAGPRILDLRGTQPTDADLAAFASDRNLVGIFLSHTDPEDIGRTSWRVIFKPPEIIRLQRKRKVSIRLTKHRITEDDLAAGYESRASRSWTTILHIAVKLIAPLTSLATAAIRIVRGDS